MIRNSYQLKQVQPGGRWNVYNNLLSLELQVFMSHNPTDNNMFRIGYFYTILKH